MDRSAWHLREIVAYVYPRDSKLRLSCQLRDLDDHKLGWFKRRERHDDIYDSVVDVLLRSSRAVADHTEGLAGRGALEGALREQSQHEVFDRRANGGPERVVIGLEDHPPEIGQQGLLQKQCHPADRHIAPLLQRRVVRHLGARAEYHDADTGKFAQTVHANRIQRSLALVWHAP